MTDRIHRANTQTPEQRQREKEIREKYQREKPTMEDLIAEGAVFERHGDVLDRQARLILLRRDLCLLLASYEMDEPHADLPRLTGSRHYPTYTAEEFASWLAMDHHGDCTGLPAPCIRCYAEMIRHKANWLAERLLASHPDVFAEERR